MMRRKLGRLAHDVANTLDNAGRIIGHEKSTGRNIDVTEYMAGICDMAQVVYCYRDLDFEDSTEMLYFLMAKHAVDMEERAQKMKLLEAADE